MRNTRRAGFLTAAAVLASVITAFGTSAFALPAGGVKGDPQPELKPFKIGTASSAGTIAIYGSKDLLAVYDVSTGNGQTRVCTLLRGKKSCHATVNLVPLSNDSTYGVPQVIVSGANIYVLQQTCCDKNSAGGDLVWLSTDHGSTYGAPHRIGTLGINAAALIGTHIVFAAAENTSGAQVGSISLASPLGTPASIATATSATATDIGVGSYKGGALVASDHLGSDYTTYVAYAPSGDDPGSTSSYHNVGKFSHEQLLGISGSSLLTVQTGGKQNVEVRFFNGTGFGSAHAVPGMGGGGPEAFTIDRDPGGMTHVFGSRGLGAKTYHLIEESTKSGSKWIGPVDLGNAISSKVFSAALDSNGSGLVLGTQPAWGYPVLAAQSISFTLKSGSIKRGKSTTGSGKVSPVNVGRVVTLQVERSGKWFNVATTKEKAGGAYSFTIKGSATGTFHYRAVVSDRAGYEMFGYSNSRSLKVTS